MVKESSQEKQEPRIGRSIMDDLGGASREIKDGLFRKTMRRDYRELKETFLSEDRSKRLETMGRFKSGFYLFFWFLKSLYLRLALYRRILLLVGIVLVVSNDNSGSNGNDLALFGSIILLFILLLELKDKILARSELETGRSVQRALMPERQPHVPGWSLWLYTRPANDVGGDLIDFMRIEDNKFGIALGDLAGKGLGAALSMAKLQATIRAIAPDRRDLAALGAKINQIYHRDRVPNSFASVVYLEIETHSQAVHLLNAGHMPPVVVGKERITELPKGAAALGILPDAQYSQQTITLDQNDFLLAYSDGLTEARDEAGHFFGEKRLLDALPALYGRSAEDIGASLLNLVETFVGEAPTHDDISLAIIMWTGQPEPPSIRP